jgi:alanine dehydrogenase
MEAKEFDFEFPRGDTCPIKFTVRDKSGEEIDLSTMDEIYFTVKKSYSASDFILQKKKTTGGIVINGSSASIILEHDDTKTLKYGNYVYDVQIKSGNYVKTVLIGTFTLTNEATHYNNE